jgi:hypothetical protein
MPGPLTCVIFAVEPGCGDAEARLHREIVAAFGRPGINAGPNIAFGANDRKRP